MKTLCKIRDIQRSVMAFEERFENRYGICLNEGMALCSLHHAERLSSGEMAELMGLSYSNTSKVLASIEKKGFAVRNLGERDKRQMYFSITPSGRELIGSISCDAIEIPELLKKLTTQ